MRSSLFVLIAGKLKVRRTEPDPCENKNDAVPPAYQNHVTHWWDGSQLYGSDRETHDRVRSFVGGKLKVDDKGFLPLDPKTNIDITGKMRLFITSIKPSSRGERDQGWIGYQTSRVPYLPFLSPILFSWLPLFRSFFN